MAITGAACPCGAAPVTAIPRAANAPAPTTSTSVASGSRDQTTSTSKPATPTASMMATEASPIPTAAPILPVRYAHPGSGVPRMRLRIPSSRSNDVEIARFV